MKIVKTFLVALLLIACQNKKQEAMNDKKIFHFGATVTNPHDYPVEIHEGYIANDKEMMSPFMNVGRIDQAWDNDGSDNSGGTGMPTNFSLTWLSYAEKKFWLVEGKISPAAQAKIQTLFEAGYEHTQWRSDGTGTESHITYKTLCFGLAPSGLVVLWLAGEDRRVEIETYQAKETHISPNAFYRNPDNLNEDQFFDRWFKIGTPEETQAYIAQNGLPLNRWRNYRKKFNYRFNINFYKEDREPTDRQTKYFNGETEYVQHKDLYIYQEKALPSYASLEFNKYNADVDFDGDELLKVFSQLSKNHPNKNIDINVKVAFEYETLTFTVQCEDEVIPLKNVKVKMWENYIDFTNRKIE